MLDDQNGWRQSSLHMLASKHDMKHILIKTIAAEVLVGCLPLSLNPQGIGNHSSAPHLADTVINEY